MQGDRATDAPKLSEENKEEDSDDEAGLPSALQKMFGFSGLGKQKPPPRPKATPVSAPKRPPPSGTQQATQAEAAPSLKEQASAYLAESAEERSKSKGDSDKETADSAEDGDPLFMPIAMSLEIPCFSRCPVSAQIIHPVGNRMVAGGMDGQLNCYDFHGLTMDFRPYRSFEPHENHPVECLCFSPTGSIFLVGSGDSVVRMFDSQSGRKIQETVRGDMYIRDINHTFGHTHGVRDIQWHPFDRNIFASGANDCSVRIFNIEAKLHGIDQTMPHQHVLKFVDRRNLTIAKIHVTKLAWSPTTGKTIVGGTSDGSLQLFHEKRVYSKPDRVIRDFHGGRDITSLHILSDDHRLISRAAEEGTVYLWDLRKFKEPIRRWHPPASVYEHAQTAMSPSETLLAVAGGGKFERKRGEHGYGSITFIDIEKEGNDAVHHTLAMPDAEPTTIEWSEALNQIFVGCFDGKTRNFYDPEKSRNGALLFSKKPMQSKAEEEVGWQDPIFVPGDPATLPAGYRETRMGDIVKMRPKDYAAARQKTKVPEHPIGGTLKMNYSDAMIAQLNQGKRVKDEDSTEVLRRYAEKASSNLFMKAYSDTQPNAVLDYDLNAHSVQEELLNQTEKCFRCGLKLCTCGYMQFVKDRQDMEEAHSKRRRAT